MRLVLLTVLVLLASAPAAHAEGIFVADCELTHTAADDPIVFHGMPGASHLHEFFGNATTDAHSTYRSLRRGEGQCLPAGDRSAYWVPALFRHGKRVKPVRLQAYYQDFGRYGRVLPFPRGLRVVAGDAHATRPQTGIVRWTCEGDFGAGLTDRLPSCGDKQIELRVRFPDCWDGMRLDSRDHHSHMAYAGADGMQLGLLRCPASHPVVVPQLQVNVFYPLHRGGGVSLASGRVRTAHADFFNAWTPSVLAGRVDDVLNGGRACDDYLGCTTISAPNTEPVTARPRKHLVDRFYSGHMG
jgi:hypothetical protein